MYRLGEVKRSHRKFYIWLMVFVILVLIGGILFITTLKPHTTLSGTPKLVTQTVRYDTTDVTTFEEPLFRINLPTSWKLTPDTNDTPTPNYTWHGTSKADSSRWISVYIDKDVSKFAVNRALYVQSNSNSLNVLSDVSDNCTTFTGVTNGQSKGVAAAKWQGIGFVCDVGNYERNVTGTVSPDGLNTVTLMGETSGLHHIFLTYTDNSPSADYSFFTSALKSFRLK